MNRQTGVCPPLFYACSDALNGKFGTYGKTSVSLDTGWSASYCDVIYMGKIAILQVNTLKKSSAATGWQTFATLPNGLKPKERILWVFVDDSTYSSGSGKIAEVRLNTDGTMQVYGPQTTSSYWGGFVYIIE